MDFFTYFKISLRNAIRVSNSLDPDQAGQIVRPDLGPVCKSYQKVTKVPTGMESINK